jgi:DNA-binding response OmpR family regulator
MEKLLIAVDSQPLAEALEQVLGGRLMIHTCSTGKDLCIEVDRMRPDALIVGLRLPDGDAFAALAQCRYKPAVIIGITDLMTAEAKRLAAAVGIGALVPIPCSARYVAKLLEQLMTKMPSPEG